MNMIIAKKFDHVIFQWATIYSAMPSCVYVHSQLNEKFILHKLPSQIAANKEKEAEQNSETKQKISEINDIIFNYDLS